MSFKTLWFLKSSNFIENIRHFPYYVLGLENCKSCIFTNVLNIVFTHVSLSYVTHV